MQHGTRSQPRIGNAGRVGRVEFRGRSEDDGFAAGQLVQTHAVWQVKHIAFRSGLARFSSGHRHSIQDPGVRSPRLHDEVGILFGI